MKYWLCFACTFVFGQWEVVRDQRCRETAYTNDSKASLVSSLCYLIDVNSVTFEFNRLWKDLSRVDSKTRPNPVPNLLIISFSGLPWHGAVSQNIFLMYISIKRHSWFFKSWWCLLYFGHVRMRRPVKIDAILFKIVLKCAKECLIL